jgi:uncharacterized Zn finger protein
MARPARAGGRHSAANDGGATVGPRRKQLTQQPADAPYRKFAEELLELPAERQIDALVSMMAEMRQQLEEANARLGKIAALAGGAGA